MPREDTGEKKNKNLFIDGKETEEAEERARRFEKRNTQNIMAGTKPTIAIIKTEAIE